MTTPSNTDREQSDADQVSNSGKLDQLIDATKGLTRSNDDLAIATVEYQERARAATRRFRVTIVFIVLTGFAIIWRQNYTASQSRAQFADCITPGHACYQQGQDRTAAAVAAIVAAITTNDQKVAARAAACAPAYVTLPLRERKQAIYECIVRSK